MFYLLAGSYVFMLALQMALPLFVSNPHLSETPFECGFSSHSMAHLPFSSRFFLLTVIFVVFDVELILLLPVLFFLSPHTSTAYLALSFFFFVLLVGLYHEWREESLAWAL